MHHSLRAHDPAGFIPQVLAFLMHDPHLPGASSHHPVLNLVTTLSLSQRPGISRIDRRSVLWMYRLQERLVTGSKTLWLKTKDAVHLVRPAQLVRSNVKLPTPQVRNRLRPCHPGFTLPQSLLRPPLLRDVQTCADDMLYLACSPINYRLRPHDTQ